MVEARVLGRHISNEKTRRPTRTQNGDLLVVATTKRDIEALHLKPRDRFGNETAVCATKAIDRLYLIADCEEQRLWRFEQIELPVVGILNSPTSTCA